MGRLPSDPLLATIPQRDRERLAIHNLAKLNDARAKIAALLDCDVKDAEQRAIRVRDTFNLGG